MAHPWLHPGLRVLIPALYKGQPDRTATVVKVTDYTRQLWVRFDGSDAVREISTFHARPMPTGAPALPTPDPAVRTIKEDA